MAKKKKTKAKAPEPNYLCAWRDKRKMSQEKLAGEVGTTKGVISLLENGGRRLSDKWARKLAPALGIKAGWLLDQDPTKISDDVLEIWARIPEEKQDQAILVLRTFTKKADNDA